jgi:hypothetical protein
MRIPKLLIGALVATVVVAVVAPAPAGANALYRRVADVEGQTFATWGSDDDPVRMQPPTTGNSQEWVVVTGAYSLITMIQTYAWPEPSSCLATDPAGGPGSPLRLVSPCAFEHSQEWFKTGHADGTWSYQNRASGRCAGYLPGEANPVLRDLPCDGSSNQRFSLNPYL